MRFLRLKEVVGATGLSRMTIWRLERSGEFPRRRRLGPRSVAWLQSDVEQWIESRPVTINRHCVGDNRLEQTGALSPANLSDRIDS